MEYYFNELDPVSFQRLVNTILVARYGENVRLAPLRGSDGGRDAETAPGNPYFRVEINEELVPTKYPSPPSKGRYLFQFKHHRTLDMSGTDARQRVLSDFQDEMTNNVLPRQEDERVNYFFLVTNVSSSSDSLQKLDKNRRDLLREQINLHADIWWQEELVALLDQMPFIWTSFPQLFAGGKVPFLGEVASDSHGLPHSFRLALAQQYRRDKNVKFRQIELEKDLVKLFVDLDVSFRLLNEDQRKEFSQQLAEERAELREMLKNDESLVAEPFEFWDMNRQEDSISAISMLLRESRHSRKIILEGGPGQGKSTITQMATQIYRQQILQTENLNPEGRWRSPLKSRLPFRIELKLFAEWLVKNPDGSVDEYLSVVTKQDSGGEQFTVESLHRVILGSPVFMVFDGLDEVGNDDLRDEVLAKIRESLERFRIDLGSDVRAIITTRPPAIAGRQENLIDFVRIPIVPMNPYRIKTYLDRWLSVQIADNEDRQRVQISFERRQQEPHVQALAKNPMQLSVLLHFIRLKGEAFPDRRAELYREYFQIVIDRDVEKSSDLRKQRSIIEALHEFLGYKIHAFTEAKRSDGSFRRESLLQLVHEWLKARGSDVATANDLFKLGEERLGLIVILKGEGREVDYGFEIQPVREYFAAAFINSQIKGNANKVFQAMIRRAYWREVALFFAGLRRENEKEELIQSAQGIDSEGELGWRQDGRALILQLLQEGVLSEPQYVFSDALDFVMDLLDPNTLLVQNEPNELLRSLPTLIRQSNTKRHYDRLMGLMSQYKGTNDEDIIRRLYLVGSKVFSEDLMREQLLAYEGTDPETIAKVRFAWPAAWKISMEDAKSGHPFWDGVPDPVWAEYLWETGLITPSIRNLPTPLRFHSMLVEQFAGNPTRIVHPRMSYQWQRESKWAVWHLLNYQQTLRILWTGGIDGDSVQDVVDLALEDARGEGFSGLDETTTECMIELINISKIVLTAAVNNAPSLPNQLAESVPQLVKNVQRPGILGWLSWRCAINMLATTIMGFASGREYRGPIESSILELLNTHPELQHLISYLRPLAGENNEERSDSVFVRSLLENYFDRYMGTERQPTCIRLAQNDTPISLVDLLSAAICKQRELPFKWIRQLQFTRQIIRPLLEKCRTCTPELLIWLSELRISPYYSGLTLTVGEMQRILKVCRSTTDPKILSGALVALSTSKFLNLAKKDLTIKILGADRRKEAFAGELFQQFSPNVESDDPKIKAALIQTAQRILNENKTFSFGVTSAAASYLASHIQVALSPLLEEETNLGISVGGQ